MHGGQHDVDERAAGERGVHQPERGAEDPSRVADRGKDPPIREREQQSVQEMDRVTDHAGAAAIRRERRSQEQRDVHAGQPELLRNAQARREDDGPDHAAGESAPQRH